MQTATEGTGRGHFGRRHYPHFSPHLSASFREMSTGPQCRASVGNMGPSELRIGQLLGGKYRLQELLALGGMGLVYAARHEATGRALAIKLLRPELATRPDLVRRVSAE